jgi:hypothetical protein
MSGTDDATFDTGLLMVIIVGMILFFIYIKETRTSRRSPDHAPNKHTKSSRRHIYAKPHRSRSSRYQSSRDRSHTHHGTEPSGIEPSDTESFDPVPDPVPIQRNNEFIEIQYHQDYNDTITAINNLTSQKELFNLGFLPVKETVALPAHTKQLVDLFIKRLNTEIRSNVSEYLHPNSGWGDMGKRPREKSGFEKQQEELGIPGSLYTEPASKAPVRLIGIDKAEQHRTDDQIRFIIHIIIAKPNVQDQMVLRVHFFMEKGDLTTPRDDRANFFDNKMDYDPDSPDNHTVIIEQVFVTGYLTNNGEKKTAMDRFHDYRNVQRLDGTMDQEKVIRIMMDKHKDRENELKTFMCTVDDDTKQTHDVGEVDAYTPYRNTRTIMDDLAQFPQHSFGDVTV